MLLRDLEDIPRRHQIDRASELDSILVAIVCQRAERQDVLRFRVDKPGVVLRARLWAGQMLSGDLECVGLPVRPSFASENVTCAVGCPETAPPK